MSPPWLGFTDHVPRVYELFPDRAAALIYASSGSDPSPASDALFPRAPQLGQGVSAVSLGLQVHGQCPASLPSRVRNHQGKVNASVVSPSSAGTVGAGQPG